MKGNARHVVQHSKQPYQNEIVEIWSIPVQNGLVSGLNPGETLVIASQIVESSSGFLRLLPSRDQKFV